MKNKIKYIIIFCIFSVLTFIYGFYFFEINRDEIWNYGFAHNIYTGLIPYKDFNMIIPPLFAFSTIPMFVLFGDSLFSFHLYSAIILGLTITIMYKKIGPKAFLIFGLTLFGYIPTYNMYALFLFSILILLNSKELKNKDIYLGIIISLIFLTKQTIGVALLLPCLYYSKNKIKTIISFFAPLIIFIIYLLLNGALYNFIDYCFLGMLSFVNKNQTINIYSIITFIFCIFMIYKLVKTKFKKQEYFYALMFQIITLPIGDWQHFWYGAAAFLLVALNDYKFSKQVYLSLFCTIYIILISINSINITRDNFGINIYKEDNAYYGKNISRQVTNYMDTYTQILKMANELEYDKLFVFSSNAYLLKLSHNQTINKFDLINNGNMGYKAHTGYIEEIEEICQDKECVFIVENYDIPNLKTQINKEILKYVPDKYMVKASNSVFSVYKTEKITVK